MNDEQGSAHAAMRGTAPQPQALGEGENDATPPAIAWRPCESYRYLPQASGLYRLSVVVGASEALLYIGQSRCIRTRVATHFLRRQRFRRIERETGEFIRVHFSVTEPHERMEMEKRALMLEVPYMNKEYAFLFAADVPGATDYVIATIRAERRALNAAGRAVDDLAVMSTLRRQFGREEKEQLGVYASRGWGPGEAPPRIA